MKNLLEFDAVALEARGLICLTKQDEAQTFGGNINLANVDPKNYLIIGFGLISIFLLALNMHGSFKKRFGPERNLVDFFKMFSNKEFQNREATRPGGDEAISSYQAHQFKLFSGAFFFTTVACGLTIIDSHQQATTESQRIVL